MAYEALRAGANAPIVFNGANEVAVEAFLGEGCALARSPAACARRWRAFPGGAASLEDVFLADHEARAYAQTFLGGRA